MKTSVLGNRHLVAVVIGLGLGLWIGGTASAEDDRPEPTKRDRPADDKSTAPAPDDGGGRPWPPGFRGGRGLGFGAQGGPVGPNQKFTPGSPVGGLGNRMGPPSQRGPFGPRHPGGPPRWPHSNWDSLEQNDPEMYELLQQDADMERRTRELAIQYRRSPREQRTALREQLEELVDEHFDVRQERRRLELTRLEEELKRLREAIDQRQEGRKGIIEKRVAELLGEDGKSF